MICVPFEFEQVEFVILIPGIPLPETSKKECGLSMLTLHVCCLTNRTAYAF